MPTKNNDSNNLDGDYDFSNQKIYEVSQKKITKKATFMLPADLHKRLKTAAVEQDKTMLEIVEEALRNHLKA
ncbi:hypothetical protein [Planococcus donghaensis]|uniref:CopG family transcriptional regulator n=1 Tax=Planococcus donghaensis TaxID=414778 RepID=A0A1C7ED94_9BACL|nr:hypothetical protein [Planococcus donghaensis]ANU22003.1 hypothetical protein BCM40_01020 [Planococcus donghaensis]